MSYSAPAGKLLLSAESLVTDRQEWHRIRATGVTATDVRVLAGHGYRGETVYERWLSKIDPQEQFERTPGPGEDIRLSLGNAIEPVIQGYAEQHLGVGMRRVGLMANRDQPLLMASCDRLTGDGGVAEFKMTTGNYLRPKDDDEDPSGQRWNTDGYLLPWGWWDQVQTQLLVTGCEHAYVCALIADSYTRAMTYWRVTPDDVYGDLIWGLAEEFWDQVLTETPPPPDLRTEDLSKRWPRGDGDVLLTAPQAEAVLRLIRDRATFKAAEAEAKVNLKVVEDRIKATVGGKTRLLDPDGKPLLSWANRTRTTPDWEHLREVLPELDLLASANKTTSFRALAGVRKIGDTK